MTYRAGIVGCGRIGCGFDDDPARGYVSTHAGAYTRTQGFNLVALADVDIEKLSRYGEKFSVSSRYQDYVEMLSQERLDVLSICTWDDAHLEIVQSAVKHGVKAIFCEKPIADSLAAAAEMIRVCKEQGTLLMIDHQRRFDPFHQQIAQFVQRGSLGRIQQVTCYYTAGVANTGTHLFDLLRFYLGEVAWVQGWYSTNQSPNPKDPNIDARLGFAKGPVAAIQACDVREYLIFEVSLLGTAGRLRVTSSGFDIEFEAVQDSSRFAGYRELVPVLPPINAEGPHEFMLSALDHLAECLNTEKKPICSGEDGRAALEVICALHESANADGKRIELPLSHSEITIRSR